MIFIYFIPSWPRHIVQLHGKLAVEKQQQENIARDNIYYLLDEAGVRPSNEH